MCFHEGSYVKEVTLKAFILQVVKLTDSNLLKTTRIKDHHLKLPQATFLISNEILKTFSKK